MDEGKKDINKILQELNPKKNPGIYIYTKINTNLSPPLEDAICFFRETEGITLVLEKEKADAQNLEYDQLFSWITLNVHTSLNAIGLTAAISGALTRNRIPCNIIAAYTHDHLFVPVDLAEKTLSILHDLSKKAPL